MKKILVPTDFSEQAEDALKVAAQIAKKHNIIVNVDNCFATPIGQTPIDLGADLVVHSATKWIDGQGRVLGGAVVGKKDLIHEIDGDYHLTVRGSVITKIGGNESKDHCPWL